MTHARERFVLAGNRLIVVNPFVGASDNDRGMDLAAASLLSDRALIKLRRYGLRESAWGRGNCLRLDTRRGGREEVRHAGRWRRPNRSFHSIPHRWAKYP